MGFWGRKDRSLRFEIQYSCWYLEWWSLSLWMPSSVGIQSMNFKEEDFYVCNNGTNCHCVTTFHIACKIIVFFQVHQLLTDWCTFIGSSALYITFNFFAALENGGCCQHWCTLIRSMLGNCCKINLRWSSSCIVARMMKELGTTIYPYYFEIFQCFWNVLFLWFL